MRRGGSGVCPQLPLTLPHSPVPVAVGAPPQEEVGKTLGAGLRGSGPGPEEGRGGGGGRGGSGQGRGGYRQGGGRDRAGLMQGGGIGASVGSEKTHEGRRLRCDERLINNLHTNVRREKNPK